MQNDKSRKNGIKKLAQIAEQRQGFFTTKQALKAGFSARSHLYHVQAGDLYSHETALSLHDLSDVMPAKLHMTVPKSFRRFAPIPRALILHRANLSPQDSESIQGVQVTKPLQTVVDLLTEGRVSKDVLIQALREGLRRGIITTAAIKQTVIPKEHHRELQDLLKRASH
jgi:predicted transcriptional regulator of viral defense system